MVVGFMEEEVREHVGDRASYVVNERYAETNSLYSFMLAREAIHDAVLVMNCDVIFHPFFVDMLNINLGSALVFDSSCEIDDEQMKVATSGDWLVEMRKDLPDPACCGENVGLIRLDSRAARNAFRTASELVAAGRGATGSPRRSTRPRSTIGSSASTSRACPGSRSTFPRISSEPRPRSGPRSWRATRPAKRLPRERGCGRPSPCARRPGRAHERLDPVHGLRAGPLRLLRADLLAAHALAGGDDQPLRRAAQQGSGRRVDLRLGGDVRAVRGAGGRGPDGRRDPGTPLRPAGGGQHEEDRPGQLRSQHRDLPRHVVSQSRHPPRQRRQRSLLRARPVHAAPPLRARDPRDRRPARGGGWLSEDGPPARWHSGPRGCCAPTASTAGGRSSSTRPPARSQLARDDGRGGDPAAGGGGGLRPARQAARPSQAPDRLVRPPRPRSSLRACGWCASRTSSRPCSPPIS